MRRTSILGTPLLLALFLVALSSGAFAPAASSQTRDTPPPRVPASPPTPLGVIRDQRPTPVGTGSIKGRVIDGVTGRGIARARVRLTGPTNRGPVLTDDNGGFVFEALPAGPFRVMTEKSTYLMSQHPDVSRSIRARSNSILLKDKQEVDDVTITMFHSGAIAGRVVDTYGDPIEGAAVMVMYMQRNGRTQQRASGMTNDLGEYRVSRLQAGRYLVRVRSQLAFQGDPGGTPSPDKPLPVPLPVYFPSALSQDQAQTVVVNRGETVSGIDVTLAEGVPTVVTGIVLAQDNRSFSGGSITYRAAGNEYSGMDGGAPVRPDGSFRFQLPPGDYIFEARAQPPSQGATTVHRPETELFGMVRVNVAGEKLEGLAIPIGGGATATGRIIFEGTTAPPVAPSGTQRIPMYNPDGPGCRPGTATIEPDWTFKVEGLGGACASPPGSQFGRWTLKAVMVGERNLMDETVTFEPGQHYGNVRLIVTDKRPMAEFRVVDDAGQPATDYAVVVFPADKERWSQLQRLVRTMASPPPRSELVGARPPGVNAGVTAAVMPSQPQTTRLTNIALGDYYAIAVDDMDPEDTQDPAVLEKLISSAVRFTMTEAPVEVPLRKITFAEIVR
jgi:hypothetical protein